MTKGKVSCWDLWSSSYSVLFFFVDELAPRGERWQGLQKVGFFSNRIEPAGVPGKLTNKRAEECCKGGSSGQLSETRFQSSLIKVAQWRETSAYAGELKIQVPVVTTDGCPE